MTEAAPEAVSLPPELRPNIPRGMALPTRHATGEPLTPSQALTWLQEFFKAMHHNPRLPVDVDQTLEPDGALTLRITPNTA